jgi:hypothetical protein
MRTRPIIVALVAFALGATVDRFVKLTGYDTVIESLAKERDILTEIIRLQKAELNEIKAALTEPEE